MEKISQAQNINHKIVIMVDDQDCAVAIMYSLGIHPEGVYKHDDNSFYCAFLYDNAIEKAIKEYEAGELKVTLPGFIGFYEEAQLEWAYAQQSHGQHYENES